MTPLRVLAAAYCSRASNWLDALAFRVAGAHVADCSDDDVTYVIRQCEKCCGFGMVTPDNSCSACKGNGCHMEKVSVRQAWRQLLGLDPTAGG